MNLSEIIKQVSKELNISGAELAKRSNQSPQNLSKKLVKNTLSYEEFENLMELMGASVELSYSLPGQSQTTMATTSQHAKDQMLIIEKQLEVERLKSKYFADISYEFRTALEVVDGGLELAQSSGDNADRMRAYLYKILPAVHTLNRLVEDNPFNRQTGTSPTGAMPGAADSLTGSRVLLVDDNELNREIVQQLLANSGAIVTEAGNGREAVNLIENGNGFDFVLMDIQMPVMDGYEATRRIRALPEVDRSATRIIAMTAMVTDQDRQEAATAGMDGFLEKPLDIQKLSNTVRDIMKK